MTNEYLSVALIEPNRFNPNVMQEAEFQALKKDMGQNGPEGVDPILVSPHNSFYMDDKPNSFYIIVDGEHRWKAAKELLWDKVRCEVREINEIDAKGICYRKNKDRGSIDPFKEASLFKSELDLDLKQKDIAEKYLVAESTVSQRLSLLNLSSEVKTEIQKFPRGKITPSHLEPIATLPSEQQKNVRLIDPFSKELKPVKQIAEEVAHIKHNLKEQTQIKKALQEENVKFPKCPRCKSDPGRIHHIGLPFVTCSKCWHDWSLETGRGLYESVHQNIVGEETEKPKTVGTIRCVHTIEELTKVFLDCAQLTVPQMELKNIEFQGKLDDHNFGLDINTYGKSIRVSANQDGVYVYLGIEEKAYKTGEKSAITLGTGADEEEVKRILRFVESAFEGKLEFGEKKGPNLNIDQLEEDEKENGEGPVESEEAWQ
jgi:ParB/RepB/Spo0J family partition protein